MAEQKASTEELKNVIANNGTKPGQPQNNAVSPYRKIEAYLVKMKPQLEMALPKDFDADRLTRIALTTFKMNPKLLDASVESLIGAVLQSAQLGLMPNLLGSCYFIPYHNKQTGETTVSFQIGYKGLIDLVYRSGNVLYVRANAVCENDEFKYRYGINEELDHVPAPKNRGNITHFYAYAKLKNGGHYFDVMTVDEINQIRDRHSQAFQGAKKYNNEKSSVWAMHYEEMAKKTIIKRMIKYLPISVEVQNHIASDETIRKDITSEPEYIKVDYDESNVIELPPNVE
jgi:recombination protein RecT